MALGASASNIIATVAGQAAAMTVAGVVAGIAGALALARLMEGLVFGISTHDPWTFALAAVVLVVVSLVATAIPARRAATLEPIAALRDE